MRSLICLSLFLLGCASEPVGPVVTTTTTTTMPEMEKPKPTTTTTTVRPPPESTTTTLPPTTTTTSLPVTTTTLPEVTTTTTVPSVTTTSTIPVTSTTLTVTTTSTSTSTTTTTLPPTTTSTMVVTTTSTLPPTTTTIQPSPTPFPKVGDFNVIPSNFDINSELVPSWGTGAIPASAKPDVVGAFRFICNASHFLYDDPIVYPGKPGASHLHQFFGNTLADANSTYQSLRTTGMSTCNSPLNRSAYWMPAMMNGKGQVVKPDFVSIYYKRRPVTDPLCQKIGKACVDLPKGLRFIFGYNMLGSGKTGGGYFNCDGTANNVAGAVPGHYPSIIEAAKNCPAGASLGAVISAPECWDGVNLDSADHRSHVAYSKYIGQSYAQCPATHPYVIPTFTLGAWYTTDATLDRSGVWDGTLNSWHLSSDEMLNSRPGSTFHTDWFGAWDDSVMQMWSDNCINNLLNCSGGDLGNGKQLKMYKGFSWKANPRLVDPPPMPMQMMNMKHK